LAWIIALVVQIVFNVIVLYAESRDNLWDFLFCTLSRRLRKCGNTYIHIQGPILKVALKYFFRNISRKNVSDKSCLDRRET